MAGRRGAAACAVAAPAAMEFRVHGGTRRGDSPQQYALPSWPPPAASPHVWEPPAEIASQLETVAVDTAVGTFRSVVLPSPTWP